MTVSQDHQNNITNDDNNILKWRQKVRLKVHAALGETSVCVTVALGDGNEVPRNDGWQRNQQHRPLHLPKHKNQGVPTVSPTLHKSSIFGIMKQHRSQHDW